MVGSKGAQNQEGNSAMGGKVRETRLDSRTVRARLKRGPEPHSRALAGHAQLGYQIWKGEQVGRWLLRRFIGRKNNYSQYRVFGLGLADDAAPSDGERVLNFEQAEAKARAMTDAPKGKRHKLKVR